MSDTTSTDPAGPQGAPLKRILSGQVPVFLVHRSYNSQARIGEVFDELESTNKRALGLGIVAKIQDATPKNNGQHLKSFGKVPLRIADPEIYKRPDSGWDGYTARTKPTPWDYLRDVPSSVNHTWVNAVLKHQFDAGATTALSATGWVTATKPAAALASAMTFVNASRTALGANPMFVNLTMDFHWLADAQLRGMLLHEMTESREKHWYLRFYWPIVSTRYGQLTDENILRGYKILCRAAALEGKKIFLPNTGLTGWLMTSFGATGFSTGTSWPEQAFARQRIMGSRKGQKAAPRTPRMFDRALLHTLDYTTYGRMQEQPTHRAYETPFSRELEAAGHTPEVAGLHYLTSVGNLQAKLAKHPNIAASRAVGRGMKFIDSLDKLDRPFGASDPTHLGLWNQLLS